MTFHAGFDADQFPGLSVMEALRRRTNLAWCGFYLPAPSHRDRGWCGNRDALAAQGWGLAPIYVGQQIQGPGSKVVTADQGERDGYDAVNRMLDEGFDAASTIYLDCEEGPSAGGALDPNRVLYLAAWAEALRELGVGVGVYCSHLLAAHVRHLAPDARIWGVHVGVIPVAPLHTTQVFPTPSPSGCGFADATAWQHTENLVIGPAGVPRRIMVDLDVSTLADPGAPPPAAAAAVTASAQG